MLVDSKILSDNFVQMISSAVIYDEIDEKQAKTEFFKAFGNESAKFMSALNEASEERINLRLFEHIIGRFEPMNLELIKCIYILLCRASITDENDLKCFEGFIPDNASMLFEAPKSVNITTPSV